MLRRKEKTLIVEDLKGKFLRQRVSIFTNLSGVSVAKLSAFRRELKTIDAEFKVAKKTMLERALEAVGPSLAGRIEPRSLEGEIGVVFGYGDQAAPAKTAAKFSKENPTFKVLKGFLGGTVIETGEILALAKLPSREQLLATVAYALNTPIRGLAHVLAENMRNLVVVLTRITSQK